MQKYNAIRFSLPHTTYNNTRKFAQHIDCVTDTGNPKAATAVKKVFRTILNLYTDDTFQQCLENEGIDTLAYIQKCVKKGMKESLAENKEE